MQETLKKLEQIQEVDLQSDAILRRKAELPQRVAGLEHEIKEITQKYDEKQKVIDELDRSHRQQTGALELNEDRIRRSQEKLEQIKTNQEYQALLKEIDSLKKNSAIISENAKKVRDELDKHKEEFNQFGTRLAELKSEHQVQSQKIAEEESKLNSELAEIQKVRNSLIVGVNPRYLTTYDRIRTNRYGIGIAPALDGNCKACNMRIPPQIYIELQRGTELHLCPSCKRILIYKGARKEEAESPSTSASTH